MQSILEGRTASGERIDINDPDNYDPNSLRNRVLQAAEAARLRGDDPLAAGREVYFGSGGASSEIYRRFGITLEMDGVRVGQILGLGAAGSRPYA